MLYTVKPVLSGHSKRRQKLVFKTDYCLMQVKSIAECSKGSFLQYFRPSLCYHLPLTPLFCLFLSGPLRQVLLYNKTSPLFENREKWARLGRQLLPSLTLMWLLMFIFEKMIIIVYNITFAQKRVLWGSWDLFHADKLAYSCQRIRFTQLNGLCSKIPNTFSFCSHINCWFSGSSLIWVCAVCLGICGRQLVLEILEHLPFINSDIFTSHHTCPKRQTSSYYNLMGLVKVTKWQKVKPWSKCSFRSGLIWVYTVCLCLFVQIFRVSMKAYPKRNFCKLL